VSDAVTRNVERQIEWYGEPLGDRFGRLLARLSLSQAQLAGVLGLSAPMLSQLMSGQRSKNFSWFWIDRAVLWRSGKPFSA